MLLVHSPQWQLKFATITAVFFFFFFLQKNSQSQIDKILPSVLELPRLPKSPMMFCLNQPLHHAKYQRDRRAKHFPRSGK